MQGTSFRFDPKSGALYIRRKPGEVHETLPLSEGIYFDIDADGDVLGVEFLSLQEFAEWASSYNRGGVEVELPEHIEDPEAFRFNLA